jgi:hypothetical protein
VHLRFLEVQLSGAHRVSRPPSLLVLDSWEQPGLIFKEAEKDVKGSIVHVVHGLTTSASLWLSSAVGVACGGELYFSPSFCVGVMLILLRFGPRASFTDEEADADVACELTSIRPDGTSPAKYSAISVPEGAADPGADDQSEASSLLPEMGGLRRKLSVRRRPNLGYMV